MKSTETEADVLKLMLLVRAEDNAERILLMTSDMHD